MPDNNLKLKQQEEEEKQYNETWGKRLTNSIFLYHGREYWNCWLDTECYFGCEITEINKHICMFDNCPLTDPRMKEEDLTPYFDGTHRKRDWEDFINYINCGE